MEVYQYVGGNDQLYVRKRVAYQPEACVRDYIANIIVNLLTIFDDAIFGDVISYREQGFCFWLIYIYCNLLANVSMLLVLVHFHGQIAFVCTAVMSRLAVLSWEF